MEKMREIMESMNDIAEQLKDLKEIKALVDGDDIGRIAIGWLEDREFELNMKMNKHKDELNEIIRHSRIKDSDPRGCARHSLFQDDMGEE